MPVTDQHLRTIVPFTGNRTVSVLIALCYLTIPLSFFNFSVMYLSKLHIFSGFLKFKDNFVQAGQHYSKYYDYQYKLLTKRSCPQVLFVQAIKLFGFWSWHAPRKAAYFQPGSSQSTVAWVSCYIGTS